MKANVFDFGKKLGCHQRPDRSFFFRGRQFPVCARCTGVLVGEILAIGLRFFIKPQFMICVDFTLILLIDWMIQHFKIKESTNFRRLITGILGGFGLLNIEIDIVIKMIHVLKAVFTV